MRSLQGSWVLPISSSPIRNGVVVIDQGKVVDVGSESEMSAGYPAASREHYPDLVILPGLVNSHTHLSLGSIRGLPKGAGLTSWIRALVEKNAAGTAEGHDAGTQASLDRMVETGTVLVGEIMTERRGLDALENDPRVHARVYFEFLGVGAESCHDSLVEAVSRLHSLSSARTRGGLSPHAPYSTNHQVWSSALKQVEFYWSSHIAESQDEVTFLDSGTGPLAEFLKGLGIKDHSPVRDHKSGLSWLDSEQLLTSRSLLVHGTQLSKPDMARLGASDAFLCLCPGSNQWMNVGRPKVESLLEHGVNLCLGTDSWASNEDVNLFREMQLVRQWVPRLAAETILQMATQNGARALGFEAEFGSIRPGASSQLLGVRAPAASAAEAQEGLLGGISHRELTHLGDWPPVC